MSTNDLQLAELVRRAQEVRKHAYAPYSYYAVGAALLTDSGAIFTGANVENAAYPTCMCAERAAVFNAVSAGERNFQAIAVVTENAGTPCGACRQVLSEFGLETLVIVADSQGEVRQQIKLGELLPQAFGPADLHSEG